MSDKTSKVTCFPPQEQELVPQPADFWMNTINLITEKMKENIKGKHFPLFSYQGKQN